MSKKSGLGLGSVSLILIFAVLCLTVFTLLTLSTARSDYELSKRLASSAQDFYAGDTRAEEVLAQLRAAAKNDEKPSLVEEIQISYSKDGALVSYLCPIDENRSISVLLHWENRLVTVMEWVEIRTADWVPHEDLEVWSGNLN